MAGAVLSGVGCFLLVLGLLLATIGLYGLLRRPDIFHQLHPAGLVTGPATILVLLAAVGTRKAEIMTSAALVVLFVLVTSPLSSHAIAQAAFRRTKATREPEPAMKRLLRKRKQKTAAPTTAPATARHETKSDKPAAPAAPTPPAATESNLDALRKARERADRRTKRD